MRATVVYKGETIYAIPEHQARRIGLYLSGAEFTDPDTTATAQYLGRRLFTLHPDARIVLEPQGHPSYNEIGGQESKAASEANPAAMQDRQDKEAVLNAKQEPPIATVVHKEPCFMLQDGSVMTHSEALEMARKDELELLRHTRWDDPHKAERYRAVLKLLYDLDTAVIPGLGGYKLVAY